MENRFGFKDLILVSIMALLVVLVLVGMKQYDRQWPEIQALREQAREQTQELVAIRRILSEPNRVVASGAPAGGAVVAAANPDAFARVRAAQKMPGYAQGDWYIDSGAKLDKITPLTSGTYDASVLQSRVLESLATRDPVTLDWQPMLAASWEIIAPPAGASGPAGQAAPETKAAPTGAVIKFKMRPGVIFSDGQPVTADDIIFTYQQIMNPAIEAPRERSYYSKIASVTKTAPDEVTFVFSEPYFESFDLAAGMPILAKHFYSKFTPDEFNTRPGLLLGSGPYRLEDPAGWTPGKPLYFVRNERYWGEPGPFDRVVFREIDNEVARMTAFRNGEVDLFDHIQPEQFTQMLKDKELVGRTQQQAYETPTRGYRYIAWNEERGGKPTLFADKRVRQALTMLTDRQAICTQIYQDFAIPTVGPFFYKMKQHDPSIQPWPFDPARAKAMLAEAGFKDTTGDGVLKSPSGQPFRFKLTYPSGVSNYQQIALFLKDAYARVGIVLEPDPLDWSVFGERLKNRDFDAISLMWAGGIESDIYQMFHSSQIADGGDNMMSYRNPEFDRIVEQARRTVIEAERMPLWHQAERILHEDQPYTFMFTPKMMSFMDNRFHNVQMLPLGLSDILEWYVPKPQQKWTR